MFTAGGSSRTGTLACPVRFHYDTHGQARVPDLLSNVTHSPLIATPLSSATQCIPPPQDTNPGAASLAPISSDRAFRKDLPYLPVGISHAQRRPMSLQFFAPYIAERISHEPYRPILRRSSAFLLQQRAPFPTDKSHESSFARGHLLQIRWTPRTQRNRIRPRIVARLRPSHQSPAEQH